ncbi:gluconokinase [Companilactobacillus jidongensis]|uniref:gluconokinase n=1 Tax=Companilactobacillus jidongensis TaxID=2486006 RepID=UPI000F76E83A|nr:gluconokinase [Companilactobacillus jidongensis]
MKYIIGIDIGTTSTKCVLYDLQGTIISHADVGYQLIQTEPGMAEEDPEEIFQAVLNVLKQVLNGIDASKLGGVSFSTAMHSLILMDENDHPLTRAITWADNRAVNYTDKLNATDLGAKIYAKTGTPIHPMAPLSKMLWLKNDRPDLFAQTKKFIDIKSYIFFRLFGVYKIDYSIASATGMFNIFDLQWEPTVLKLLNIEETRLPDVVNTTASISGINQKYGKLLNIKSDVSFIFGASDGVLSNLGVDAIDPRVVAVTIGTSGAVRVVVNKPVIDPDGKLFCYALTKNKWVVGGPVNNGGIVFRWIRDQLFDAKVSYDDLTKIASHVPAGSNGLLFQPYLGGERAPIWNAYARGSFFGLTRQHTKSDMVRSALEGIVFNLYSVMCLIEKITGKPTRIQATGGFARSALWRQMLADIFDQDVTIPESFESSCLGAAVLGMCALGYIKNLSVVKDMVGTTDIYHPNEKNVKVYQELFPIWQRVTRALEPEYKCIAEFQNKQK